MNPALGVAGLVLEAASLVWRGSCRDRHRAWKRIYNEEQPRLLLVVRFYSGGRCVLERPDGIVEIRKIPGSDGPSALGMTVNKVRSAIDSLVKKIVD